MIIRQKTIEGETLVASWIYKDCILINCNLNGAIVQGCKIVNNEVLEDPECEACE